MSRQWLLAGGMLAGAALAVIYIVRLPQTVEPAADAVAWVNERPISRGSYEAALEAVAGDRKTGTLRPDDRERVMQRLIDQELLIDRAGSEFMVAAALRMCRRLPRDYDVIIGVDRTNATLKSETSSRPR